MLGKLPMKHYPAKILFLLIIILASIIPNSCKKDPIQYTFKGHLSDYISANAVADVNIKISQIIFSNSVANANYTSVANLTSNLSGDYEVTFNREKVTDFKIELDKEGYFSQENIINPANVTTEEDNIFNYVMEPKAWVRFQIKNFSPHG